MRCKTRTTCRRVLRNIWSRIVAVVYKTLTAFRPGEQDRVQRTVNIVKEILFLILLMFVLIILEPKSTPAMEPATVTTFPFNHFPDFVLCEEIFLESICPNRDWRHTISVLANVRSWQDHDGDRLIIWLYDQFVARSVVRPG